MARTSSSRSASSRAHLPTAEATIPWPQFLLYVLFALSGFSGLIYESIWTHYLKLFLGHAAYAQTLVLALFMGGMALGAWWASRLGARRRNLLMTYALVEGVIGLCALVFHSIFVAATDAAYASWIPALGSTAAVEILKWTLSAALILPQTILLGMTFPFMSAAVLRRFPRTPGASISTLYFCNSLGAAVGVLASGFVLIESVGLPGTVLTAGLINIVVALIVWRMAKDSVEQRAAKPTTARQTKDIDARKGFLIVAFITGAASFLYEIGWIRMLSLVLGASTHAFELMLSAFILGLALGGWWIRRRIDRIAEPTRFLGFVQVAMGLFALLTLVAYNASFDVMKAIMSALARTDGGYRLFNLGSHAIALGIMLPATFCAGTTLPLITYVLLRRGGGEASIGRVYSANTVGAIAGVLFAIHVGLPTMGVKGVIALGAALDMALGIVLLRSALKHRAEHLPWTATALGVSALLFVAFGVQFDSYKMVSAVYRFGALYQPGAVEVLFHQDGKTATVDLVKHGDGGISVRTNAKSDAVIDSIAGLPASGDEVTMTLLGAVPVILHPQARTAANIGFGSGLSTHVLLAHPTLERVDTIEIEPAMVRAARGFYPRVDAAFDDPRSHIYIDDAKAFFAAHRARYDIIVSEPSNPWVSGIGGLFSDEFYRRARTHLNPGGLFVQWLQAYEIDLPLVASVMKAVGRNFNDYAVFAAHNADLIIVATPSGRIPEIDARALAAPRMAELLRIVDIRGVDDFMLRRIGDRTLLEPLFASMRTPMNSDYFPILDLSAVRTRFLNSNAFAVERLTIAPLPVLDMLDTTVRRAKMRNVTHAYQFERAAQTHAAILIADYLARNPREVDVGVLSADTRRHLLLIQRLARDCGVDDVPLWLDSVFYITSKITPFLPAAESMPVFQRLRVSACYARLAPEERESLVLFDAIARRDAAVMARISEKLLALEVGEGEQRRYILGAGMLGYLAQHHAADALRLWQVHAKTALTGVAAPETWLQLLYAHSAMDRAVAISRD